MGNLINIKAKTSAAIKDRHQLPRPFYGLAALLTVVVLQGCATYSSGFAKVENATANRDLEVAVKTLDELKLTGADEHYIISTRVLYCACRKTIANPTGISMLPRIWLKN
jgi:hypothetical protein